MKIKIRETGEIVEVTKDFDGEYPKWTKFKSPKEVSKSDRKILFDAYIETLCQIEVLNLEDKYWTISQKDFYKDLKIMVNL